MRDDALYLEDLVAAADAIATFLLGVDRDRFLEDDLIRSAVLQKLIVMGEAAGRVSEPLRARHPDVPWSGVRAFRNFAVHVYFAVDWVIVWETATGDAPALAETVRGVLRREGWGS